MNFHFETLDQAERRRFRILEASLSRPAPSRNRSSFQPHCLAIQATTFDQVIPGRTLKVDALKHRGGDGALAVGNNLHIRRARRGELKKACGEWKLEPLG